MSMRLDPAQEEICKQHIRQAVEDAQMPLPDGLETGKVYRSSYYKYGNRGAMDLQFIIHEKQDGLEIVFFLVTDDYSLHGSIDPAGKLTKLENYEGQFGWPVYDDTAKTEQEHARIKTHNEQVAALLRQKGFET